MPRFSGAFGWRKSTADELQSAQASPDQPSFRVLERNQTGETRNFDGGAKMSRPSGHSMHRPSNSDPEADDNIFSGLNVKRPTHLETFGADNHSGSGSSNTTKATSTASSRHSNASTAPSSADVSNAQEDRAGKRKMNKDIPPRPLTKSSTSSFLDRAGRTFSFGGQKKHPSPSTNEEGVPDVPSIPSFQRQDETGRTRALTASTTSTATPPKLEESSGFDMGGDFGSMFSSFDKRASTATLKNDGSVGQFSNGQRHGQPAPLKLDTLTPVEPPASSWNSQNSRDNLMGIAASPAEYGRPPPVPRHQPSFEYRASASPEGVVEDEDARLLADSVAAGRFLVDGPRNEVQTGRYRREAEQFSAAPAPPPHSTFEKEDNMFAGTTSRFTRPVNSMVPRSLSSNDVKKVMTPAEFERYRMDKEREGLHRAANPSVQKDDDDDEDEINYEDDEDEEDKLKQQAKNRRTQQASMAAYRQKNMKTTGELRSTSPLPPARAGLPTSLSAPHLGLAKTPSPEPAQAPPPPHDDDDEDVPLAILQAHGFPNKNRQPGQLSSYGSNPNLRGSMMPPGRPASVLGEPPGPAKRHSTLPAFARNLPQDPFVGASIARPAVRESLSMGVGSQNHLSPMGHQPQQQGPIPPGGLVGVIASEERSRAMRRGSPNMESQKFMANNGALDPMGGIPSHMMYSGANGAQRQQPPMSVTDQAQLQMSQQMSQFMQMQMQFMQMMAANQQGGMPPQMPPQLPPHLAPQMMQQAQMMQQPYPGFAPSPSVVDFSSGASVMGVPAAQPRRPDPGMRTMSMIQPNTTSSFLHNAPGFAPAQAPPMGYTPSIAPSERSNIGLPNRYRPVSQAGATPGQGLHPRSQSMSGALTLSGIDDIKGKSTIKLVHSAKNQSNSDDDDEEGWQSMQAKRDQKKSKWRIRKRTEDVY